MQIYPVILSGGSGTRLWPMSRTALPKQLLPLASKQTMLQETVSRLKHIPDIADPILICNNDQRFLVAEQLREIDITPKALFLEPFGRNTAPAVAIAALSLSQKDPNALMLVLPADHLIKDAKQFGAMVKKAAEAADKDSMVTFGIVPSGPETGYGYIQRGDELNNGCYKVARFVEKPDLKKAKTFIESGDFYWNSGMFLFKAGSYLTELKKFQPEIEKICREAIDKSAKDLDFCRINEEVFTKCPSESIDYAVMEHTDQAVVVPVDIGWSDIGSWSALWEVGEKDADGNVIRGDVYTDGVKNSYIRADRRMIAAIGLEDVVIIETTDALLVAHKNKVQDVKKVVEHLKSADRTEYINHTRVFRPWGWYEGIDGGERFQVKRIMVKPGEKLSLQMHHHRAEHWVVVTGTAQVTCGEKVTLLSENESTYIPLGETHRLENCGKVPLHIIEVQSGSYLGEDDIVRFEDIYKRK